MRVLALDTTTRAGSVALVDDQRVLDERSGDPSRAHAQRLPADILALVHANQTTLAGIDLFAVACGPGSFTGLRIGIATMQGLAFVHARKMVGVPALEALAQVGSSDLAPGTRVAAWMDAHRRDVFAALYRVSDAPMYDPDRLVELEAPTVGSPQSIWDRWSSASSLPAITIGDGATMYDAVVASGRVLPPPTLAGAIGRMAVAAAARGRAVDPAAVHPLYVRRPDAEIARDNAPVRPIPGT